MNYLPEKADEFRSHKHFVIPSLLRRYQDLHPQAKPYKGYMFKKEYIYLRKDIIYLHTMEQWRRLARKVVKKAKPIKTVKGYYNDKTKMAKLYASWQTEKFVSALNPDGSIPENQYGNIELFSSRDLPDGTTHVTVRRAKALCKQLGIDHKEAVTGFSVAGMGMSYPVVQGVVVHTENVDQIMKLFEIKETERLKKLDKKYKNEARATWKWLIKKVSVKRYVSSLYDRDKEEIAGDIPLKLSK